MKRKYITPQIETHVVCASAIIATSIYVNPNQDYEITEEEEILVKQNPFGDTLF